MVAFILVLSISGVTPAVAGRSWLQQPTTTVYEDRDRGVRLYQQGDFDGATKALRAGIKRYKDDAEAWHYLGLSLAGQEKWKDARKAFEKEVALRPDSATAHANLSHTLLLTKAINEAGREASQALLLNAQNAEAHYVLGVIHLQRRSCREALNQANDALTGQSDFPLGYLLRSQALICDIASRSLRSWAFDGTEFKTLAVPPKLTDEERLAKGKETAMRFKEAAANLESFLKLAPLAPDATMWKEQLETLRLYAEPADMSQAPRTLFSSAEVTTKVRVLSKPEPTYTEKARAALVEGTVVLRAVFAADGTVKNILVLNDLPGGLTARAIDAARKIKFAPAVKDGRPVSTLVQLEYNFNLY